MRLAVVQYRPGTDRDANLKRVEKMISDAAVGGADVVLLPELFAVPFVPTEADDSYFHYAERADGPSVQLAKRLSARHQIAILSSAFEASSLDGVYHNSAFGHVNGELVLAYRKSHLPLSHAFHEKAYFRPGDDPPQVFQGAGTTLGTVICYERHFPELMRILALKGTSVALIPVATANASKTSFHAELRGHAIANQMFVAAANRVGVEGRNHYYGLSAVFDPSGELMAVAGEESEEVLSVDLDLSRVGVARRAFPFYRDRRPELYAEIVGLGRPHPALPIDTESPAHPRRRRLPSPLPSTVASGRFGPDAIQHHTHLRRGDVGRYILLPGDPARCETIAAHFDDARHVATSREFTTYSGTLLGEQVSVASTGIGGPSAAIAVEELVKLGADTFIRIGTSGGMQDWITPGTLGIAQAAIRDEGTSRHYLPIEFPAVADLDVTLALRDGARRSGAPVHVGVVHSKDSYYGQHEPDRMPIASQLRDRWEAWTSGGAICSEMEVATLYTVASSLHKRAGALLLIAGPSSWSSSTADAPPLLDLELLIRTAIEGVMALIEMDRTAVA